MPPTPCVFVRDSLAWWLTADAVLDRLAHRQR